MKPDLLDHEVGPAKPAGPVASRLAYWGLIVLLFCGLMAPFLGILKVVEAKLPGFKLEALPAMVFGLAGGLAPLLARALLRRWGLRAPGWRPEWTTVSLDPDPEAGAEEVTEIGPGGMILAGAFAGLGGAGLFALLSYFNRATPRPDGRSTDWPIGSSLFIAFFLLGSAWLFVVRFGIRPTTRVDATGVWGYPRGLAIRRRFIPWSAIGSAEIGVCNDPRGRRVVGCPLLRGWHGEQLIILDVADNNLADRERLVRAIRAHLPKPRPGDLDA